MIPPPLPPRIVLVKQHKCQATTSFQIAAHAASRGSLTHPVMYVTHTSSCTSATGYCFSDGQRRERERVRAISFNYASLAPG